MATAAPRAVPSHLIEDMLLAIVGDNESEVPRIIERIDRGVNLVFSEWPGLKVPPIMRDEPSLAAVACLFGAKHILRRLGDLGVDWRIRDKKGRGPAHFLMMSPEMKRDHNLFRELEWDLDWTTADFDGFAPAHYAAFAGCLGIVRLAWQKGWLAEITAPRPFGKGYLAEAALLELAAGGGHLDAAQFIVENEIRLARRPGKAKARDLWGMSLVAACRGGFDKVLDWLLEKRMSPSPAVRDAMNTEAAGRGNLSCLCVLGQHNQLSSSAMLAAAEGGHVDVVRELLHLGFQAKDRITVQEMRAPLLAPDCTRMARFAPLRLRSGYALQAAVRCGHEKVARLLISHRQVGRVADAVRNIPVSLMEEVWATHEDDAEAISTYAELSLRLPEHLQAFVQWSGQSRMDLARLDLAAVFGDVGDVQWVRKVLPLIDIGSEQRGLGVLASAIAKRDWESACELCAAGARVLGGHEGIRAILRTVFGFSDGGNGRPRVAEALFKLSPTPFSPGIVRELWETAFGLVSDDGGPLPSVCVSEFDERHNDARLGWLVRKGLLPHSTLPTSPPHLDNSANDLEPVVLFDLAADSPPLASSLLHILLLPVSAARPPPS